MVDIQISPDRKGPSKAEDRLGISTSGALKIADCDLASVSFPRTPSARDRRKLPAKAPPEYILKPSQVFDYLGKDVRHRVHALVWAFRRAYGFDLEKNQYTPRYRAALRRYRLIPKDDPEKEAIMRISSIQGYRDIRQAGRARISMEPLKKSALLLLCREVRAAAVWRSRFP